ncbi:hypothetical protein RhiirA1_542128 [Rhizophagus irregularis]|uniref:Uncharacterized protein n=1 Tax=Rhizophagus irregularis TaxID=588596 RepID=A0A2N0QZ91_9GLOM|nr:hypothetical protein RhiirA1_542128 [Rhizophagus irregularis]
MNMPFVNIRISKGKKTLHGWYIHPIPYEMSVKDFFIKLVNKELSPECNIALANSEEIEHVELSETPTAIATQVSPSCNIVELTKSVGIHMHYQLKPDETISTTAPLNGFTILMQNARKSQLYFPIFSQSNKINRKQTLCNDLVNWIQNHGGGWSTQSYADTRGKEFIISLTETIWYIDMRNHKKFEERSYYIPDLFLEFFDHANPESYKQSRKLFDANELNLHCQALAPYSTSSWMLMTNFNWLRDAFDDFIIAISGYTKYLQQHRNITAINHASESPIRSIDQATTIKIHKRNTWITPLDKSKYYHLEQVLVNSSLWKHIDIEEYLPIDPV